MRGVAGRRYEPDPAGDLVVVGHEVDQAGIGHRTDRMSEAGVLVGSAPSRLAAQ